MIGRWVWFTRKGSFWSKSHKRKGSFVFFGKVPSKLVKISRNLSNSLRNLSFSNKEPFLCCSSDLKEPFLCCKGNIPSCARPNGCIMGNRAAGENFLVLSPQIWGESAGFWGGSGHILGGKCYHCPPTEQSLGGKSMYFPPTDGYWESPRQFSEK